MTAPGWRLGVQNRESVQRDPLWPWTCEATWRTAPVCWSLGAAVVNRMMDRYEPPEPVRW